MTRIVRYQCKWCGREFKTPHLHQCKFDPDCRNCMSCRFVGLHHQAFTEGDDDHFPSSFECHKDGNAEESWSQGGWNDYPTCCSLEGKCSEWRIMEGYTGVQTFKQRMRYVEDMAINERPFI